MNDVNQKHQLIFQVSLFKTYHSILHHLFKINLKTRMFLPILVFKDSNTPSPFRDELFKDDPDIEDDHIHLDCTIAGWGCCCLQVTFQAESFEECIHLYDQLIPLCPIMVKNFFF